MRMTKLKTNAIHWQTRQEENKLNHHDATQTYRTNIKEQIQTYECKEKKSGRPNGQVYYKHTIPKFLLLVILRLSDFGQIHYGKVSRDTDTENVQHAERTLNHTDNIRSHVSQLHELITHVRYGWYQNFKDCCLVQITQDEKSWRLQSTKRIRINK